ncbi:MAG TPA: branched-chain amino acid ABC transporter permease [Firmicutes bacterium]|nr:branched-chain amino acid ABC transporter permease [Bacillota bacterium]
MVIFLIFAAVGEAWNIITGFAGQTSFGHAAFFGIGAYTSSVLFWKFKINPWAGMLAGAVLATVTAAIVSYPAFRLKGHYFAIATLAVAEIIQQLVVSWDYVEGATGISIPVVADGFLNLQFHKSKIPYFIIAYVLFGVVLLISYLVENSKLGYYLKAIRESSDAAEAMGIDHALYKLIAMMISAFLTAIFGSLYAQYILYIDPFMVFSMNISMKIVLLVVLGGIGTIMGPVIGAAILIPLSEYTRILFGGTGKGIDLIIFGMLVVLVACYQPHGIVGMLRRMSLLKVSATKGGGATHAGRNAVS